MSFASRFTQRWEKVIAPAIRRVAIDDVKFEPIRADTRTVSDSILTEIMTAIANCRLVIADITTIGEIDGNPVRNGNVMYEVGLAQAVRQPEEVLLFRSDHDRLIFDIANVRVNDYDPDIDAEGSADKVAGLIFDSIKEVSLVKSLAVQQAVQSLDHSSMMLLIHAPGEIQQPTIRTMGDTMAHIPNIGAIPRLLELGIVSTEYKKASLDTPPDALMEQFIAYRITPFGYAVRQACFDKLGFTEIIRQRQERKTQETDLQTSP